MTIPFIYILYIYLRRRPCVLMYLWAQESMPKESYTQGIALCQQLKIVGKPLGQLYVNRAQAGEFRRMWFSWGIQWPFLPKSSKFYQIQWPFLHWATSQSHPNSATGALATHPLGVRLVRDWNSTRRHCRPENSLGNLWIGRPSRACMVMLQNHHHVPITYQSYCVICPSYSNHISYTNHMPIISYKYTTHMSYIAIIFHIPITCQSYHSNILLICQI